MSDATRDFMREMVRDSASWGATRIRVEAEGENPIRLWLIGVFLTVALWAERRRLRGRRIGDE